MSGVQDSFLHPELHHLDNEKLDNLADLIEGSGEVTNEKTTEKLDTLIKRYLSLLAKFEKNLPQGTVHSELGRQEFIRKAEENKAKLMGRFRSMTDLPLVASDETELFLERQARRVNVARESLISQEPAEEKPAAQPNIQQNPFHAIENDIRALELLAQQVVWADVGTLNRKLFGFEVNSCVFSFVERNSTQTILSEIQKHQGDREKKRSYKKYSNRIHVLETQIIKSLCKRMLNGRTRILRGIVQKLLEFQDDSVIIKKMKGHIEQTLIDTENDRPILLAGLPSMPRNPRDSSPSRSSTAKNDPRENKIKPSNSSPRRNNGSITRDFPHPPSPKNK